MKIILYLLMILRLSYTQESLDSKLIKNAYDEFFYSPHLSQRHCGLNVENFLRFLTSKKLNLQQDIIVVKIRSEENSWSFGNVIAVEARWGDLRKGVWHMNYAFHFFLIYRGKVFDFSFAQEPTVLPLEDYFNRMYIPEEGVELYGPSFRVRGEGPAYLPRHAKDELRRSVFDLYQPNLQGSLELIQSNFSYDDLLKTYSK